MFDGVNWYTPNRKAIFEASRAQSAAWSDLHDAEAELLAVKLSALKVSSRRTGAFAALAFAMVAAGWVAMVAPASSFLQAIATEAAAAIATFLALPFALVAATRNPRGFFTVGTIAAVLFGLSGYLASGVLQAFLIEAAVGTAFVMALEVFFQRINHQLLEQHRAAQAKLAAVTKRIEDAQASMANAETVLDWEYAASDFLGIPRFELFETIRSEDPPDADEDLPPPSGVK
jgi:hypothetical protein